MLGIDQNIVVIFVLIIIGLLVYWILNFTKKGKKTTRTFKRKERLWLEKEKKLFKTLLIKLLVPITLFWIFVDTLFVVFANYYFHNVIFEPLFGFTPTQTFIATILLLFLGYLIYKTYVKRGAK